MRSIVTFCLCLAMAAPAAAEGFNQVTDKGTFLSLVDGRKLTRFGIKLDVTDDGRIQGRAFGRPVTGAWDWRSGYFCRDLNYGSQNLGPNCQLVQVNGDTVRFIADMGAGDFADLNLR